MKSFKLIVLIILIAAGLAYYYTHTGKKGAAAPSGNKILFYRNPMNPAITSPVPSKDEMGMDYIPVYENERPAEAPVTATHAAVNADPGQAALLGIKTERVQIRPLHKRIYVPGAVAHDMELFDAQVEYINALRSGQLTYKETYTTVKPKRLQPTAIQVKKNRLLELGMDEEAISKLDANSLPDKSLLHLADTEDHAEWIYMNVRESDLPSVHKKDKVQIEIPAEPGRKLEAEVETISTYANPESRSVKVRALVREGHELLKPNTQVFCVINANLGEFLSVSEEAPLWTGTDTIVFVKNGDRFEPREVVLGEKAGGFYAVTSGLKDGDEIVSQGNFFIDSDSRLKAASQHAVMAADGGEKS